MKNTLQQFLFKDEPAARTSDPNGLGTAGTRACCRSNDIGSPGGAPPTTCVLGVGFDGVSCDLCAFCNVHRHPPTPKGPRSARCAERVLSLHTRQRRSAAGKRLRARTCGQLQYGAGRVCSVCVFERHKRVKRNQRQHVPLRRPDVHQRGRCMSLRKPGTRSRDSVLSSPRCRQRVRRCQLCMLLNANSRSLVSVFFSAQFFGFQVSQFIGVQVLGFRVFRSSVFQFSVCGCFWVSAFGLFWVCEAANR